MTEQSGLDGMLAEGIVGLAPTNGLSGRRAQLYVEKLAEEGVIPANMFSFSIGRNFEQNKIIIGGYDLDRFAAGRPIIWHNLSSNDYWAVPLDEVTFGGVKVPGIFTDQVVVDTGTSYTLLPSDELQSLAKFIETLIPGTRFEKTW